MSTETIAPQEENRQAMAQTAPVPPQPPRRFFWHIMIVALAAAAAIPVWRATTSQATPESPTPTPTLSKPVVAVAKVLREDLYNEVTIPAEFRPYTEVELHAKVSGFLEKINVDFGDQVKAGQLLAKLEVPELQEELDRAKASAQRAEADYQDAHLVYTRLQAVNQQHANLVAQQELDTARARDLTTQAAISVAKSEVEKCQTMQDYTRITAPFDGVITHRYADPGALIQAGTSSQTQSLPLVRISDNYRLRLDFPVSVIYVNEIRVGDPLVVWIENLGGKTFTGTISRFTHRVNDDTRTMTAEIEVPNPKLELTPGMYAKVVLKVEKRSHALTLPTEAVVSEKNPKVYVINRKQQIEERPVTLGLETSTRYEVIKGLREGELVVLGSRAGVKPGETVEPKLVGEVAQK